VALYHLRVPSSGGLRLSLLTSGEAGRLTVSEPFGSAVSLTAWVGASPATFFDLRQGCRLDAVDLERVLGISAMPLPQAVRLLAGRLPAADGDRVSIRADGRLLVEGVGWRAVIEVAPEPWRVMSAAEERAGDGGWKIELSDHTASVPGVVRVQRENGRWAKLELVRLEWKDTIELPLLPELPVCVLARSSHRVSTTDGESRRPAASVSNRAPLPADDSAEWPKARPQARAHRPRAGGGETQAPKARRNVALLRLRRPIRDKPSGYLRFAALVTKPGEKNGLV